MTCLQRDGVQLFYAGETVYLENGGPFSVGGDYPDYAELLPQAAELFTGLERVCVHERYTENLPA